MSELTIDDLQTIVIQGDRTELIRVVGPLDSDQREKLVAGVLAIAKFTNRDWGPGGLEDSFKDDPNLAALRDGCTKQKYADWRVPRWTANLMALAICDRKVIEKPYEFELNWLRSDLSDMP